jgi:hypothetical protein
MAKLLPRLKVPVEDHPLLDEQIELGPHAGLTYSFQCTKETLFRSFTVLRTADKPFKFLSCVN